MPANFIHPQNLQTKVPKTPDTTENIAFLKPICYYKDTKSALRQIRSEKMKTYDILLEAVEKNRRLILDAERYIWKHPETGYREWKTSAYLEQVFEELGYTLTKAGDIPGFYADADTGRPGPTVACWARWMLSSAPIIPRPIPRLALCTPVATMRSAPPCWGWPPLLKSLVRWMASAARFG